MPVLTTENDRVVTAAVPAAAALAAAPAELQWQRLSLLRGSQNVSAPDQILRALVSQMNPARRAFK